MPMSRSLRLLRALLVLAGVLAALVWLALQMPTFGGPFEGERLARMRQAPQFVQGRFENSPPYLSDLALVENLRLYSQGQQREPQFSIPVMQLAPASLSRPPASGLRMVWFGHASVLVEIDGVRIMTDPMLSERASPVQIVGPKRFHPPPIALEQLRGIDAVVISHDHYDHLDVATVRQLAGGGTQFYVGLGIGAHLERWGVAAAQIHELGWWQSAELRGVRIHCAPARHYSGRKRMDNSTLWASWMLRGPAHAVYFSGDTGYAGHFREVRERLGAPDVALLKVGAYGSTWLDIHMDPESAVRAHGELGARTLLPVHWATFNLAYHAWDEPILRTLAAATAAKVDLVTPRVGEVFEFGQPFRNQAWYRPGG